MKILLNDRDIRNIPLNDSEGNTQWSGGEPHKKAVAKAQAKKIFDELNKNIVARDYWSPEAGCKVVSLPMDFWSSLQKEIKGK